MRRHSLVLLLALAVALSGCGRSPAGEDIATAGGPASGAPDPDAPAADPADRARQFAACMRDEGVDMPDPEVGNGKTAIRIDGPGVDKQKIAAAMEKCRRYLPNGGNGKQMSPEDVERMRQYAQCMRDNGVPDFPDPDPNGGFLMEIPKEANREALERATEKCRQFMPDLEVKGGAGT